MVSVGQNQLPCSRKRVAIAGSNVQSVYLILTAGTCAADGGTSRLTSAVLNAAVVFASVPGRTVGVVLVGVLLWAWRPGSVVGSPALDGPRPRTLRGSP